MAELKEILEQVRNGTLSVEQAEEQVRAVSNLGFANLDLDREKRTGFPEVIYAAGKSEEQLVAIFERLMKHQSIVLATRVSPEQAEVLVQRLPMVEYHADARAAIWSDRPLEPVSPGYVSVVAAGTSDWAVAQEAAWTIRCLGAEARVIADVGVAGIHRLFQRLDEIRGSTAIVCVAGMEGALASVIAGLVDIPVIAVPTSVGYGANFRGLAALLSMLNACATGVAVVNIDNGFGAGYMAGMIHRQSARAAHSD
ncbi:nickel pincer cofactor biosynthesis protein LarB [Brevibacillus sp. B_LB10_24]|uniref:nickel pincer cofactor biosynthesis protein LarB n=1 Tax=Brevibacillus sp. B_LB10_24 TaxID=3380645 RepID=UPI0038B9A68E